VAARKRRCLTTSARSTRSLELRRGTLERTIAELVPDSPCAQTVARLRCLPGIDTLSAVGLAAEIGDFDRFQRAGGLTQDVSSARAATRTGQVRPHRQCRVLRLHLLGTAQQQPIRRPHAEAVLGECRFHRSAVLVA
jgi:hypothetical protein